MFILLDLTYENLIAVKVDGHITKGDYDKVTPLIDKAVKDFGKVKLYIQIDKIEGIEPGAFVEDVKTYFRNFNHMEKIAVVGETKWHKLWSKLASPFVSGDLKYFTHNEIAAAQLWVQE